MVAGVSRTKVTFSRPGKALEPSLKAEKVQKCRKNGLFQWLRGWPNGQLTIGNQ